MDNPALFPAGLSPAANDTAFPLAEIASVASLARPRLRHSARTTRAARIAILGYYGYGNLGDEMSLGAIVSALEKSGADGITVIGRRPYRGILPTGVKLADGRSPRSILSAIMRCDTLIAGGGTLLQNATGEKSLTYYTSLMRLAAAMGKEVKLYGGVGPVTGDAARGRAAAALRSCSTICVRDSASAAEVKDLCGIDARRASDPIFFTNYMKSSPPTPGGKYVAVQLRRTAGRCASEGASTAVRAAEMCRELSLRTPARPVFVSMQDSYDLEICRLAASLCDGEVVSPATGEELFSVISGARAAVGMRLHFLLAAVMSGIPAVALSYDPKVDSAARMFDLPLFPVDELSPGRVCEALQKSSEK